MYDKIADLLFHVYFTKLCEINTEVFNWSKKGRQPISYKHDACILMFKQSGANVTQTSIEVSSSKSVIGCHDKQKDNSSLPSLCRAHSPTRHELNG